MFKKFIGLVLLSVGLVACGSEQGSVPEVEENTAQTVSAENVACYRVEAIGTVTIIDDDFPKDYKKTYELPTYSNHTNICEGDYWRDINMQLKHGDEMRVEIDLRVHQNTTSKHFSPKGEVRMYEGWDNNTRDMDGRKYIDNVYVNKEYGYSLDVEGRIDSNEWNDDSRVFYNIYFKSTPIK